MSSKFNLITRMFAYFGESKIALCEKIIVIFILLIYILSPIDVIPDFIPILGWLDDAAIAFLFLSYAGNRVEKVNGKNSEQKSKITQGATAGKPQHLDDSATRKKSFIDLPDNKTR